MPRISCDTERMITTLPGNFKRIEGKPGFWFRCPSPPRLYSFIILQHSAKGHAFGVDLVSSVFDDWDKQYGRHQLVKATGLQNVRLQSQSTPMEEEYYLYDSDYRAAIDAICVDLKKYALPWFEAHAVEVASDAIVRQGFEAIEFDPKISLDELKSVLRKKADFLNASKWHRQETKTLAIHLRKWAALAENSC